MRMLLVAVGLIAFGCTTPRTKLKTGTWRGTIELQGQKLPFNFEIAKDSSGFKAWLKNGGEKILLEDVRVTDDSAIFVMHIFDASLRARISDGNLNGVFVKHFANNYRLPFSAVWGEDFRFTPTTIPPTADFNGKYSVTFIHGKDTTSGVGIFRQKGNYAEGTFLNPEGDYRYLEGNVMGDTLLLSTFDGHHAFIFRAVRKNEQTITGDYWSGKAWHQTWTGQRNDNAALPMLNHSPI